MNQKKAKALRRALRDEMPVVQLMPKAQYGFVRNKLNKLVCIKTRVNKERQIVNLYRIAKGLYNGSVRKAVQDTRRHRLLMVSLGKYRVA